MGAIVEAVLILGAAMTAGWYAWRTQRGAEPRFWGPDTEGRHLWEPDRDNMVRLVLPQYEGRHRA